MSTYREELKAGEQKLLEAKIDNAMGEAWYFFEYAFSMDRMTYLMDQTKECQDGSKIEAYHTLIRRRIEERIPMQYLLGTQQFMGLEFKVNEHVLIPRQDTEVLIEEALAYNEGRSTLLDMCTGSGCIAVSLCYHGHFTKCTGVDISKDALAVAKENGKNLAPMVEFKQSDLFSEIEETYDMIVSNPPYITTKECQTLMPEVREHEPMLALDGHEDGLYFYRKIIKEAVAHLNTNGMLFFEIGYDQGESVPMLMKEAGFCDIVVKQDLAGLDRVVYGRYDRESR